MRKVLIAYTAGDTLDEGATRVLGGTDGKRFHHATQDSAQFKNDKLFIIGIFGQRLTIE